MLSSFLFVLIVVPQVASFGLEVDLSNVPPSEFLGLQIPPPSSNASPRASACVTLLFGGTSRVSHTFPPLVEPRPMFSGTLGDASRDRDRGATRDARQNSFFTRQAARVLDRAIRVLSRTSGVCPIDRELSSYQCGIGASRF
jgi:hypothetical protein